MQSKPVARQSTKGSDMKRVITTGAAQLVAVPASMGFISNASFAARACLTASRIKLPPML
jgi:hypothetical protein